VGMELDLQHSVRNILYRIASKYGFLTRRLPPADN
jgi:hypothetical protein